jgi:hypothetical protein
MEGMLPMLVPQRSFELIPIPGPEAPTPPPHDPPAPDPTPDLPKPTDPRPEPTDPELPEPQFTNGELRGVSPSILQN